MNKIAILAIQETHLMEESIKELNDKYRHLKFFGSGLSTSSTGILFIISDIAGTPQEINFTEIEKGRSGVLYLRYGSQILNIVNVYMPNHKTQQKEALINLRQKLEGIRNITDTELLIVGDWNFVEDRTDQSPQHNDDHGVTSKMTKLKTRFDLIDGWREAHPEARSFTWEGTTGNNRKKIFSRIDQVYVSRMTWGISNKYKIINCNVSDHDGVSVNIRDASAPDTGKGEPKLNLNIMNHLMFREEADRLIDKLERKLNIYKKSEAIYQDPEKLTELKMLRTKSNPQKIWREYKESIMKASTQATQKRRAKLTKIRREAERQIKKAERDLKHSTPEREDECRQILSNCKKTLNDYDKEARDKRMQHNEAKWFQHNEKSSKTWFRLNKTKAESTIIK